MPAVVFPLSTCGPEIVDASQPPQLVRWRCVNLPGSLETLLPEGLTEQTPGQLCATIASMGFNCVRLTWSTEMLQKGARAAVGPGSAFQRYASERAQLDIVRVNPWIQCATVLQCFEKVVRGFAQHGLMVIADNHVSKAAWCSEEDDGNRWFSDLCFPVDEWLEGLRQMAAVARRHPNIVGIGLRNELLKLPILQSVLRYGKYNGEWIQHMSDAAREVHAENPALLLVAGGNFAAGNLGFLRSHAFVPEIRGKVVFESHIYNGWYVQPLWKVIGCEWTAWFVKGLLLQNRNAFVRSLGSRAAPYFLGEFGCNVKPLGGTDPLFLRCIAEWVGTEQVHFGFWTIAGKYYYRQGSQDIDEPFGLLMPDFRSVRNPELLGILQDIK